MHSFFWIGLIGIVLMISGCSGNEEKKTEPAMKKDHVLRGQMNTLQDARNINNVLNEKTQERDKEMEKLTH